jgi:hypothetical protein
VESASVLEQTHQVGLGERVEVELETHDGGRSIGADLEARRADGEDGEQIAVRMIALWWARAAVARRAVVGSDL